MGLQTRDLYCIDCEETVFAVACEYQNYPDCASCGGEMQVSWEGGQAPCTDVYGHEQYSDATGMMHSSHGDKVRHMSENGFYEAGDKVGGARNEHRINGTGFSFPGQTRRRTVSEGA